MPISVILAHPDSRSFNHAIAHETIEALRQMEHQVRFHDLYAEAFDPVLPVRELAKDALLPAAIESHCQEIVQAEGIIIVHPNWWGQPPALLKGWIDRILRPGVAYRFLDGDQGEGVPVGLLKARKAVVFNTSNTSSEREKQVFGDPLEALWKNCIFGLCGVNDVHRTTFHVVVTSDPEQRKQWLHQVRTMVQDHFPKHSQV